MADRIIDLEKKLDEYRLMCDIRQKVPCSPKENKEYLALINCGQSLPEGVYRYKNLVDEEIDEFYTIYEPEWSQRQIMEYLAHKQLEMLGKIKNGIYFFVWGALIPIIMYAIAKIIGLL